MNLNFEKYDEECNLKFVTFDVSGEFFVTCSSKGMNVFQIEPLKLIFQDFGNASYVCFVDSFSLCYVLRDEPNRFHIFDFKKKEMIYEEEFDDPILRIYNHPHHCLIFAFKSCFVLFDAKTYQHLHKIESSSPKKESMEEKEEHLPLSCVNFGPNQFVFVFTSKKDAALLEVYQKKLKDENDEDYSCYSLDCSLKDYGNISINKEGLLLAAATSDGTVVHIVGISTKKILRKLTRGFQTNPIFSLSFSLHSHFLGASSSGGTLHVWDLKKKNKRSDMKMKPIATPFLHQFTHKTRDAIILITKKEFIHSEIDEKNKKLEVKQKKTFFIKS